MRVCVRARVRACVRVFLYVFVCVGVSLYAPVRACVCVLFYNRGDNEEVYALIRQQAHQRAGVKAEQIRQDENMASRVKEGELCSLNMSNAHQHAHKHTHKQTRARTHAQTYMRNVLLN